MKLTVTRAALVLAATIAAGSCDKVPLLAPSGSTVALTANATTIPTGGTIGLTAFVTESGGTAVQNGTTVRFTTTLGTVTPSETQTTNGLAIATFNAGDQSGVATVTAMSGGATGTTTGGTGGTTTAANTVKITIGAAAVSKITVSANPASVSPNGGTSTITATVLDANGGSVTGVPVTFSSDQGVMSPSVVSTDVSGHASATLTTSAQTVVTATSGAQSATVTVAIRPGPSLTLTCAPAGGTGVCTSVAASDANNTVAVTFTVSKATGSSALRDTTIDFGDGITQGLGTLSGGSATVSHTYNGPSGSTPATYTATVRATDVNGEIGSSSTAVSVTPRNPLSVDLQPTPSSAVAGQGESVSFTADVTGGIPSKFDWDFDGDGTVDATTTSKTTTHVYTSNGAYAPTVTVTTTDGRTVVGRTEFLVSGI